MSVGEVTSPEPRGVKIRCRDVSPHPPFSGFWPLLRGVPGPHPDTLSGGGQLRIVAVQYVGRGKLILQAVTLRFEVVCSSAREIPALAGTQSHHRSVSRSCHVSPT